MIAVISFLIYTLISVSFVCTVGAPQKDTPEQPHSHRQQILHILECVILFALLYTFYNVFCTLTTPTMGYDRTNYSIEFNAGNAGSPTLGLYVIYTIVRAFGGNIYAVFYFSTFFFTAVSVWAFFYTGLHNRYALTLFVLTDIIFFSFTALKQIYACAFAVILFAVAQKKTTLPHVLICLSAMALACLFHNAALILIPTYPLLLLCKSRQLKGWQLFTLIGLLLLSVLFLDQIAMLVARLVEPIKPSISSKIIEYFTKEDGSWNKAVVLKGLPYYLIVLFGIRKRSRLREQIANYDMLLMMSALGAAMYLASIQSYWMYRTTEFYVFPICIFFGQLAQATVQEIRHRLPNEPAVSAEGESFSAKLRRRCVAGGHFLGAGVRSLSFWVCTGVYASAFAVLARWLALIYLNYGGF